MPSSIVTLPPADVMETLANAPGDVATTILDPWYNKGVGGHREDYDDWLAATGKTGWLSAAAARVSQHIFVWGFPEIVAHQVARIPVGFKLTAWLTWYYKNCPSVIRGWRSAQNACLHISAEGAEVYPEHFLNGSQLERWESGKMRFVPGPPTVLESPLNVGFVGKGEQTGHPAQKPLSVIKPLVLMTTREDDLVLDPMCGSGTTGEACLQLNRRAMLCDESEKWVNLTEGRVDRCLREMESNLLAWSSE